jgi:hypothetical protein
MNIYSLTRTLIPSPACAMPDAPPLGHIPHWNCRNRLTAKRILYLDIRDLKDIWMSQPIWQGICFYILKTGWARKRPWIHGIGLEVNRSIAVSPSDQDYRQLTLGAGAAITA